MSGPVPDRALQLKNDRVRTFVPNLGSSEWCRLADRSVLGSLLKNPLSPRKDSHGSCLQVRLSLHGSPRRLRGPARRSGLRGLRDSGKAAERWLVAGPGLWRAAAPARQRSIRSEGQSWIDPSPPGRA